MYIKYQTVQLNCQVAISVILIAGILYFKSDVFKSKCATVIDIQRNNNYTVELLATDSLSFPLPFGGRDGKVVLKNSEGKEICSVDIFVQNDGGSIHKSDWKVEWKKEHLKSSVLVYNLIRKIIVYTSDLPSV